MALRSKPAFMGAVALASLAISGGVFAKSVTITFGSSKGPDEQKVYQKIIQEFEKQNPGIKVKVDLYSGDFREKLLMQFVVGNAPDCFETGLEDFPLYPTKGYLLSLDKYADRKDLNDFPKQLLKTFSYKGHLYALTRDVAPLVMIYNKKMFSQAGIAPPDDTWNWNAYTTNLTKFRQDTNGDGKPDIYGFAGGPWENWVWQNGGDIFDDETAPKKFTLTSPAAVEALQFAADLKAKYGVSSSPSGGDTGFFAMGKAATVIGGYWERIYNFKSAKFEWDAAPVPAGKTRATTMYTAAYSVSRTSKHPAEAFKWIEFITSPLGQRMMSTSGVAVPSRLSIAKEVIPKATPPANGEAFIKALDYGRLAYQYGFRKPWADINTALTGLWTGKMSASQAVAKVESSINASLARMNK